MPTLHIMKGLPASGKSTKAEQIIKKAGGCVRVNKDLLRTMLHFGKWTPHNESTTHLAARGLVKHLLGHTSVIVDDTNLHPEVMQSWLSLGEETGSHVRVHDLTHVSVETCIKHNDERSEKNGVDRFVIANTALKYRLHTFEPGSVVLCDIDGTIADIRHRRHYVEGVRKDWASFFDAIPSDSVRESVREQLLLLIEQGKTVVFVTARSSKLKNATVRWLNGYVQLPYWTLIMRHEKDGRSDEQVKADMLTDYFPDTSVIDTVLDDRPRVIRMWRERGLTVQDVGDGVEF